MREIKFRAWDGDKKEMILPEYAGKEDFHIQADGQIVETHEYGYERHELTSKRPNSWVLMQYTGLKDKNGKEIYEGDILQDTLTKMQYVVKFGFCKKYAFNGWYVENEYHNYVTTINGDYDTNTNSQIEVIGNIYENENLLTK